MAQSNLEAEKINLQNSAKAFMSEGKVADEPEAIDAPRGFLFEWWSFFWDIFIAQSNVKHSEDAAAYIKAQRMKAQEHQKQLKIQQLHIMQQRHAQMQQRDANNPSLTRSINGIGSESTHGQSTASALAAKMYEERMKHRNSMDPNSSLKLLEANRMTLLQSSCNQGQSVQGAPGNASTVLQQIQDIKDDLCLAVSQRTSMIDPSIYAPGIVPSRSELDSPGLSQGAGSPLKDWPLAIRTDLSQQQKSSTQISNVQGNMGLAGSTNFSDMDPRRFRMLERVSLNGKEGSIVSPIHSGPPKMKMTHVKQSSPQQKRLDHLQQKQLQQNSRKRRHPSSSGTANSTSTGNTTGPSPNSAPSTPSTHPPVEGSPLTGSMHASRVSKSLTMYGVDGTGGLASSKNLLEDIKNIGDGSLENDVESFVSAHDDGDPSLFDPLKRGPKEHHINSSQGFTFAEVACIRSSNSKVVCCHFSSHGKFLASAGHEKKVVLWNMENLETESTPEEHDLLITDVRFRPDTSQLATSSFDMTVRLWDAANPTYCLHAFTGHNHEIMSIDFHPKKSDILCSCDGSGEIRLWSINQLSCTQVSKGASTQVRFQPRLGQLLAAAEDNVVSIFDFETDRRIHSLQGHTKGVRSFCWDANGGYLASVSEDSIRVWSLASGGECIHELNSNGNQFHSSVFHPAYPSLLIIGGFKSLELWNMVGNKTMTVKAHDGLIAALAQSTAAGMVASASHDNYVKIWK